MENFNFNLQKVLDYRTSIEEKKKLEYVEAQKNMLMQEAILKRLLGKRTTTEKYIASNMTGYECQSLTRYIENLDLKISKQRNVLNESIKALEIKIRELTQCMSDRKVMEKLREKAYQEFLDDTNKKEQKLNDDFALHAFIRAVRR